VCFGQKQGKNLETKLLPKGKIEKIWGWVKNT
jgi:hypothetical protein